MQMDFTIRNPPISKSAIRKSAISQSEISTYVQELSVAYIMACVVAFHYYFYSSIPAGKGMVFV